MTKQKNILSQLKNIIQKDVLDVIKQELCFDHYMVPCIEKIEISRSTAVYLDEIIACLGEKFDNFITIVPDKILSFGELKLYLRKKMLPEKYVIIYTEQVINLDSLQETIIMDKPKYLVMNRNTLSMIMDNDDVDDYIINGKARYHSYKKIPIAICEFLEPGIVDVIK